MNAARAPVWIVGTFDTKADELHYVSDLLTKAGVAVRTVDISTSGQSLQGDIKAADVASHHEGGATAVLGIGDRGAAVTAMGQALCRLVRHELDENRIAGMLGLGGSGGASMIAPALHLLPFGMPKLMVSTMAAGNVAPLVGIHDVMLLYPVTDFSGLNRLSRLILANAAHAMAGMIAAPAPAPATDWRPALGLTMFGVTTPCVQALCDELDDLFDCQVFHANGMGGRTMEALARAGMLQVIADMTTTEVGQHLAGGQCDAGPDRLAAASRLGLPWIGAPGALDMINWGPPDTIPARYRNRHFHVHNPQVTLMRSNAGEMQRAGETLAVRLNRSPGEVHLFLPLSGLSALDAPGAPFHDPKANQALFHSIERHFVQGDRHRLHTLPLHINDPEFAHAVARQIRRQIPPAPS